MAIASIAVLALAPGPSGRRERRVSFDRAVPATIAFVAALVPVAVLNRIRFGSFNPISYGPIPWTGVLDPNVRTVGMFALVDYARPCIYFAVVWLGGLLLLRKKRGIAIAFAIAGIVFALLVEPLRAKFFRFGVLAYGFVFDMSLIKLGPPYDLAADGVGRSFGGAVAKSTLQCTPILILAPLAFRIRRELRWQLILLLAPCATLYASLLRANLSLLIDGLGWPWLYIRYTLPGLPLLLAATVAVIERVRFRASDAWIALGVACVVGYVVCSTDEGPLRVRLAIVVLPLVAAFGALVAAAWYMRSSRPAPFIARACIAAAIGIGVAVGGAHDLRLNLLVKKGCDDLVDKFGQAVPERFAFFGVLGQFDVWLSLAALRDVEYADLLRIPDFASMRPVLDYWHAEHRPIYMLLLDDPPRLWSDVTYVPVPGLDHIYKVEIQ
jgi:hypothetical protein